MEIRELILISYDFFFFAYQLWLTSYILIFMNSYHSLCIHLLIESSQI